MKYYIIILLLNLNALVFSQGKNQLEEYTLRCKKVIEIVDPKIYDHVRDLEHQRFKEKIKFKFPYKYNNQTIGITSSKLNGLKKYWSYHPNLRLQDVKKLFKNKPNLSILTQNLGSWTNHGLSERKEWRIIIKNKKGELNIIILSVYLEPYGLKTIDEAKVKHVFGWYGTP